MEDLAKAEVDELTSIREIGPKVAESIHAFFGEKENRDVVADLMDLGIEYRRAAPAGGGKLEGKAFVFTGALKDLTRDEAKQIVENLGGRVVASVSKKVDYVVVGEDPGSKVDQAEKLGIKTIDEAEFRKMISG
jgi:DNA ligase (NAD+)